MRARTEPDQGLPGEFLAATAEEINRRSRYDARVDYPGILALDALGREWRTGYTGLHVHDDDGNGLPGAERLIALEQVGILTLDQYVTSILDVLKEATQVRIEDRIHELAGIIETGDPEQIIGYLRAGNHAAAVELLEQSAHIHAAAGNAGKSETLFELAREAHATYGTFPCADHSVAGARETCVRCSLPLEHHWVGSCPDAQPAHQRAALEAYWRVIDARVPEEDGSYPDVAAEAVIAAADAAVAAAPEAEPIRFDYHGSVERAYAATLQALADANLDAELIDTGGSCKAIAVTGTNDEGAHRVFSGGAYIMLTAGGPLTNERIEAEWEVGLYDDNECEGLAMLSTVFAELKDRPEDDTRLAEWLYKVAQVLR